uniref:Derlin n=1 Tax=Phaeomonas parva TaxID=124430 RepID=A0A7S1XM51_9STRA|mmetsp:Transcript_1935/g.5697  ORF Transcript_1935/g.5697 Transcript_1935/m.5697 type:complete len:330 (+) Transcript_1935:254-1243(+)
MRGLAQLLLLAACAALAGADAGRTRIGRGVGWGAAGRHGLGQVGLSASGRGLAAVPAIRGGAKKKKSKKAKAKEPEAKGIGAFAKKEYKKLKPATRLYLSVAMALTMVATAGLVDPNLMALDPLATIFNLQFWRPLTSAFFLGPLNMNMATSLYFVAMFGQELEKDKGTADYVVFLISQITLLTLLGPMLGMPYTSSSLVSAALWVSCRRKPMQKMGLGFMGMSVEAWLVPFARMVMDSLQAQSGAAALPHMLGFLTGHCYHFVTKIWPLVGGTNWLDAPPRMKKMLNGKVAKKKKKGSAIKKKKKKAKVPVGKGYKLGGDEEETAVEA